METEKSAAKSEEEKRAIDQSGFSEQQIDQNLNKAVSGSFTQNKPFGGVFSIFQSKKQKENVLLDMQKK